MSLLSFNSEYYGDQTRWFIGTVIDNSPPPGLEGRVRVRIHGIHSASNNDIPQADLPWAQVMSPSTSFGVSGFGSHTQILAGAMVFGLFLDGTASQLPIILGSLPRHELPTTVQAEQRLETTVNPYAYNFNQSLYEGVDPLPLSVENLNERKTIAMKFFIDNGYEVFQAAAIVGALLRASNLDPTYEVDDYRGIGSWNQLRDRWTSFINFAGRFSPSRDIDSFDIQLIYVLSELRSTKTIANSKLKATKDIRSFKSNPSVSCPNRCSNGAAEAFVKFYFAGDVQEKLNVTTVESAAEELYQGFY